MAFKMKGFPMMGEPYKKIMDGNDEAVNAANIKKLSNSSGLSTKIINQIIKDESDRSGEADDFSMSDVKSLVKRFAENTENADEID